MTRFICIHGHFYQPPREDPATGQIPIQLSAAPFPNWNFRIAKECYAANAGAAILDDLGQVVQRIDNYGYMSFNFGPTLLSWLEMADRDLHDAIIAADKRSVHRFGEGSALAQVCHHAILPLCNRHDKHVEVAWGIADFQHRYGRRPKGMWLSETAADTESLAVLEEHGIEFVILAPGQAATVSHDARTSWTSVTPQSLDTTQPYLVELPNQRTITVFFYDGDLAQDVAFRGALDNGEAFAHKIAMKASRVADGGLVHFATDGESYGHHHRYGEMALAFCLKTLNGTSGLHLCNYASYLKRRPATSWATIHEPSSWSCAHGVGRWMSNCGCVIDPKMAGRQAWRSTLRNALNQLRDKLHAAYFSKFSTLVQDPWDFRQKWKGAVLAGDIASLIQEEALVHVDEAICREVEQWMDMVQHGLKMFTSCGWFFDDPAGLEPVQNLRYALHAMNGMEALTGEQLHPWFRSMLVEMKSVSQDTPNGGVIWDQLVCNASEVS